MRTAASQRRLRVPCLVVISTNFEHRTVLYIRLCVECKCAAKLYDLLSVDELSLSVQLNCIQAVST
jgi:hypothetical protein